MTKKLVPGSEVEPVSFKSNRGLLDNFGREIVDGRSMEPPLGYRKTPSLSDQIRDMVRSETLRQAAEAAGRETFDEANDFDVDDDYDPSSPFEEHFDPGSIEDFIRAREKEEREAAGPVTPKSSPFVKPLSNEERSDGEPVKPAAGEPSNS